MSGQSGGFVRAVFNFDTSESGEIALRENDVVQVLRPIDDNWLYGCLYGQCGNFPTNFVEPLTLPVVDDLQKLFVGIKDFQAEVDGDLGFHRGDIIVGLQPVDENWWNGMLGNETGIFPITHVFELEEEEVPTEVAPPSEEPVSGDTKAIATVRATMDLTAQLDDELGFHTGDIIEVMEIIDSDFGIGQLNSKTGSFPLTFVELVSGNLHLETAKAGEVSTKSKFEWWKKEGEMIEGDNSEKVEEKQEDIRNNDLPLPESEPEFKAPVSELTCSAVRSESDFKPTHKRNHSYNQINTSSYDVTISAYGKAKYPFVAVNDNELSFFDDDIVLLIRHIDVEWMEGEVDGQRGIFPSSYIDIIVDCMDSNESASGAVDTSKPPDGAGDETEVYGRVLYDFHAESSNELELSEGDTVTVLRKIDDDWIEVKHDDGRIGCCPVSYVELIVTTLSPELPAQVVTSVAIVPAPAKAPCELNVAVSPTSEHQGALPSAMTPTGITPSALPMTTKPKPPVKPKPQLKPKPVRQLSKDSSPKSPGFTEQPSNDYGPNSPGFTAAEPSNVAKSKPPPLPPMPKTKVFQKRPLVDSSLDDIVQQELKMAQGGASVPRSSSVPNNMTSSVQNNMTSSVQNNMTSSVQNNMTNDTKKDEDSFLTSGMAPSRDKRASMVDYSACAPQTIGQSLFYTDVLAVKPAPSVKRRPPPRPSGPRPPPAPSRSILVPQKAAQSSVPVPRRAAPPRPAEARMKKPIPAQRQKKPLGGDLMNFSPEKDLRAEPLTTENLAVIQDLEKRVIEIEADLEQCGTEQRSLELILSEMEEEEDERIVTQEKLEFYEANRHGLNEELTQLRETLREMQPRQSQARVDTARQAEEQQRRAEMERQRAAEEEKEREKLREKHRGTRVKVIEEILKTEADYLSSLTLCLHTFFSPDAPKCPSVDLETLFCNMDQIIELSQCLLTSLEGATSGRSFDELIIGLSFVELKDDMKKAYSVYCCNHDEALSLLDKYEKNEEVQEYFGHMLEVMKHQKVFFDLGSILIKPVQRILKYPLLLNQLYKSTETEHADKQHLLAAINMMTEVAGIINELKHRKDLVLKYRKDTDSKLSDKISRITVHSAKKKFYRVTQKMVGVQKFDENFLREEKKFKDISLAVRLLVHGLSTYLEQLQDSVACAESVANDMSDYYAEKSTLPEVEQFCEVHNQIATYLFQTFRAEVDVEVMSPLNRLLLMFQGPMKVIKKRHDKELDFNKISSRVGNPRDSEQLKSMNEELQQARRTYEALNAQLLDELPQLYVLTLDVLRECVARLVHSQKVFFDKALQLVEQLLSLPFVLCASDANIMEDFSAAHVSIVESLSNLSFLPKTFSPQPDEKKPSKGRKSVDVKGPPDPDSGAQSDSQRVVITQSYPAQQLFTVVNDFLGQQQMDVSAPGGTVVGVIKEGDPMGNKDRWFVDTGAAKGFIPKKFLASLKEEAGPVDDAISPLTPDLIGVSDTSFDMSTSAFEACNASLDSSLSSPPYDGATAAPHSPRSPTGSAPPSEKSEMVCSEEPAQDFDAEPDNNAEAEYYRAVYAFEARCPIEVTLRDGMLIKVVESHDLDGNTEWWLVETEDGCQGYAPANYLYKA